MKIFDGAVSGSFREACIQGRFLLDDTENDNALKEASGFQTPKQLRSMFTAICAYCQPSHALHLWNYHKDAIIEDLLRNYSFEDAENDALHDLDTILRENGKSCVMLGLPQSHEQDVVNAEEHEQDPANFDQLING